LIEEEVIFSAVIAEREKITDKKRMSVMPKVNKEVFRKALM